MTHRLDIGFVIDGLAGGGAEKVALTLAEAMARRGHAVTVLSLRDAQAYATPPGVALAKLVDAYRGPLRRQTEILRRARQLDAWMLAERGGRRFDLAFSILPKTDRIVRAARLLDNAWLCLHGAVAGTQLADKRGLKRWSKRRQLAHTYHARRWVTVSAGLGDELRALTGARPARVETIPNPFDLDAIRALAAEPCPLDGTPFLVHVGRFHPVKRHDRLFDAVRLSGYAGRLALIGDGPPAEHDRLRAQARAAGLEERVVFAGFSANPYPWLRAADALVLSSDSEGFGNVLVEALACGTPVVSTDCPFGPAAILSGELARGLAPLDAEGLAGTIRAVLADPPAIADDALDRFALDAVVDRYLALADAND
ncbi:glycosyltransferase [Crenobacter luteus]|uniref:Glycosyltransferase subfamily 4-like N-terminal domain-containing protein n=1 Tax=Crenobacter luteus TaxID=1452487 RepID=A0A163CYI7_9NEIS|nr:glycosyltransferase [Crenobacter luteus]KZE33481.1 hypothetical protein AVW16_08045 [Crenobacter luteus]